MNLDQSWFTEICDESGSAFSMKLVEKIHEEKTPYQHIAIYKTEYFGLLMVIDGYVMLTDKDNFFYHEMMSHPVLYTHSTPKNVVIIGGGDCGTLREVLKHTEVQQVWQIEIDERVTRIAEKYFPKLCERNSDSRANFYFGDGITWIENAVKGSIDIIIIDSTDPIGPAEGLFTEPFYRSCYRALSETGIIVQQSESPLFHLDLLKRMRKHMSAAGFAQQQTLQFPQCSYPSGWWTATMAGKEGHLSIHREEAAAKSDLKTLYYSLDIHKSALVLPPFVAQGLNET